VIVCRPLTIISCRPLEKIDGATVAGVFAAFAANELERL